MDVEATTAIRQAEVAAAKAMLDRTASQFDASSLRAISPTPAMARRAPRLNTDRRRERP
jgi:hypothetical protein